MRRAGVAALAAAAALAPAGTAGGGIGLSVSPLRLAITAGSSATVTVRNPSGRPLLVDVRRSGFARTLRGRPRVRAGRGAAGWLRVQPRRLRLSPHAAAVLRLTAVPPADAAPGDHPALVLLATRPPGAGRVRVLLRVGVVVLLRVPGEIVHRLDPRALTVRHRGHLRLLDLRLANRGNVAEQLDGGRLRLVLVHGRRTIGTLRPRRLELLPHSCGIAEFVYRGRLRGAATGRIELRPPASGRPRLFRLRL